MNEKKEELKPCNQHPEGNFLDCWTCHIYEKGKMEDEISRLVSEKRALTDKVKDLEAEVERLRKANLVLSAYSEADDEINDGLGKELQEERQRREKAEKELEIEKHFHRKYATILDELKAQLSQANERLRRSEERVTIAKEGLEKIVANSRVVHDANLIARETLKKLEEQISLCPECIFMTRTISGKCEKCKGEK